MAGSIGAESCHLPTPVQDLQISPSSNMEPVSGGAEELTMLYMETSHLII